jgi:hypothetical protein
MEHNTFFAASALTAKLSPKERRTTKSPGEGKLAILF